MRCIKQRYYLLLLVLAWLIQGCSNQSASKSSPIRFTQMLSSETGIKFNNKITESDSVNVFTNEYMYNGSGVGIGDFNNDGLPDVFFCGSMESSKLYLNKGNFTFDDITTTAGVKTNSWCTGVSVVDINSDGFDDIYVCTSHSANPEKRKNLLFVNDGKLHFSEQAAAYGLADTGYASQAAFLDFDKDGDLDIYLLNHRLYSHMANNLQPKDTSGNSPAADKLYRNNGIAAGQTHPVFSDVSKQCGIKEDGYGLGLVITDVNNDNWPDIYVANDYIGNDLLWLNNHAGGFTNIIATSLRHQSYNSMGVDAADINNDGRADLAVVDMLPETNERKKMMFSAASQEKFDMQERFGYEPSYMRNMLQLNIGNRQVNQVSQPYYSEIGQMAGMAETDWSWSVLMADFDNDGWKDMHITNGLGKDLTNNDYAAFRNGEAAKTNYTFGSAESSAPDDATISTLRKTIDQFGSISMNNYCFRNTGETAFEDISAQSGIGTPSISNGAAYVDFDKDGDLDLVVNNINQEAFVWRNEARQNVRDTTHNFLGFQLKGIAVNKAGLGCKLTLFSHGQLQFAEQSPVRGFASSVDPVLHFGVGNIALVDSVLIQWPDDRIQVIRNVGVNQVVSIEQQYASQINRQQTLSLPIFQQEAIAGIEFRHLESNHFDFGYHQPLPQKYSQLGPCIATGDVNGDGRDDFFVGGAANQPGKLFIQTTAGTFDSRNITSANKPGEDLGAVFFDADADKDIDLLVTGGSFEFTVARYNQPLLYINDGKGNYTVDVTALPAINEVTDAVDVADFDADGDLDLFIGGRLMPQKYPQSPRSYLLQNNNGKFTDVTGPMAVELQFTGMITAAIFTDFNSDRQPDLVLCGEWTGIRFFKNEKGKFKETTNLTGLPEMNGLWRSVQQADLDNDGDMDYIVGNMGWNNRNHISQEQPMFLYAKDLDKNGYEELIPAYYIRDNRGGFQLFPGIDRNQLSEQFPAAKKKYLLHADFAKITMKQLQDDLGAEGWTVLKCNTSSSVWLQNQGNGKFKEYTLPLAAQMAPVNCIVATDVNNDGNIDLLLAGNEYQSAIAIGRYDASYGILLRGNGKGKFEPVQADQSGILLDGDIKDMKIISTGGGQRCLLSIPNNGAINSLKLFKSSKKAA